MSQAAHHFSSLAELVKDSGLIGQILRRYPAEVLRAADKWAAQNSDFAEKHKVPNRLPLPDPWQFLLDAPAFSEQDKTVFRAAQSQLPALRHLARMSTGIATLNTDWYQTSIEARARGDEAEYNRAMSKVADGHVVHAHVQEDVRKQNDPELLMQMESHLKKRKAQLVHRGKGNEVREPKQWSSWSQFRKKNALVVALVEWWVRCGTDGAPGLMFWRNEALTKFLKLHLDQSNLDPRAVKKIRQQIGLVPVGDKEHFVWDVTVKTKGDGTREIMGYLRNGQQGFRGLVHFQKRISPATLQAAI